MSEAEWRKCKIHKDVNPQTMWGCPDCLAELRWIAERFVSIRKAKSWSAKEIERSYQHLQDHAEKLIGEARKQGESW